MKFTVSGPLQYVEVKGLHCVDAPWWIDTGIKGCAFQLAPYGTGEPSYMDSGGRLHATPPYAWDGSSGPTVDGVADPVPSLVHDLLYEAMRARKLPTSMRRTADRLYRRLLIERHMGRPRAWIRWLGLRLFGSSAASPNKGAEYPRRMAL